LPEANEDPSGDAYLVAASASAGENMTANNKASPMKILAGSALVQNSIGITTPSIIVQGAVLDEFMRISEMRRTFSAKQGEIRRVPLSETPGSPAALALSLRPAALRPRFSQSLPLSNRNVAHISPSFKSVAGRDFAGHAGAISGEIFAKQFMFTGSVAWANLYDLAHERHPATTFNNMFNLVESTSGKLLQ
jgi:hypothetical protein